jgi:hypothetical protein
MEYKNPEPQNFSHITLNEITIDFILSFRNHPELQKLDGKIIDTINSLCNNNKKIKNNDVSNNHILKNQKLQNKKDNIENKVNLVLNKLSENNIDNLLVEFINNIGQISIEEYNIIQKTFYIKILSEINFVKVYLKFFNYINTIYNKVQNYDMKYFISIIETKFYNDYTDDIKIDEEYKFINEFNTESQRINNLMIIQNLIHINIFNNDIINECKNILFNQTKYLSDIYYWFQFDNKVTNYDINIINQILSCDNITTRDKVLLESLCKITSIKDDQKIEKKHIEINKDILLLEINNILEEYLLMKEIDDVIYFIEKKCGDALSKNKFCYNLIDRYSNNDEELLDLLKTLYKSDIINKNNINNGLMLYKKTSSFNENKLNKIKNIILY